MESINNGKATITASINEMEVLIPSKKNWFTLIFGTAWLGGWYFALISALEGFLPIENEGINEVDGFMLFWLIGWTIGGIFVIGMLLWGYFGKETLKITANQVVLKKTVFGIGINKGFKKSAVKDIRFNKIEGASFSEKHKWAIWGVGEGKIKFDYGMQTYSFGLAVADAEANYLIAQLKSRIA